MVRRHLSRYSSRARNELRTAFGEEHTPHEIALSFAIGVFVTALPSLGAGVGLFFVLIRLWTWVSEAALFAALAVLNPLVKPLVYLASYNVGAVLVGPEPVEGFDSSILNALLTALKQLVLGNLLVALALSIVGYVAVFHLSRAYRRRDLRVVERFAG